MDRQVPPTYGRGMDDGLFGPRSVTWRVHVDPILWVAGFRALYLQGLHPRVMRGTYQNSALFDQKKAWARFLRTTEYVTTRTFGSTDEVEAVASRVRAIHASLTGYDPDTNETFRLDEPESLLWVHCGEIDSYVDIARRSGILNTDREADQYVAESRAAAEVVGLKWDEAPKSRKELVEYFEAVRPQLYACDEAKQGLRNTLNPPLPRNLAPLRLGVPGLVALAFASMPGWARRMYGAPGLPTTDFGTTLALKAVRTALKAVPMPVHPAVQRARQLLREQQRVLTPVTGSSPS
jgi:uncharacterized protein (DUF2236 family)